MTPSPEIADRIAALLGWRPEAWRLVERGYTPARRYVVSGGGRSAFAKIATTPLTASMINREIETYGRIAGPFMPRLIGAAPDADMPILVIEDLSDALWPPPWSAASIEVALAAIAALHATVPDPGIPPMVPEKLGGWAAIAADPAPLLSLGLVSADWLAAALPALLDAERAPPRRTGLCHFDLRSDNICIRDGRALILDWAETCIADPDLDLGFMLPSLEAEGGPAPEATLPGRPDIAAKVSGFFAARAGLPEIPEAPFVRRVQREQLATALPWAQRALGV